MENEISHKIHKITDSEKLDLYIERDLTHLELFSRIENLMPVISCIAEDHVCIKKYIPDDSEEHNPTTNRSSFHVCNKLLQLHFACGQGSCSSLRTMRYGVEVIELKSKKLPENHPNCIWTYNEERNEGTVSFIIISFSIDSKAIVLSFNGEIIAVPSAELQRIHRKFEKDHLLDYVHISNDSSIQVFSHGVRYKFGDNKVEWILPTCKCPSEGSRKKSTTEQLKCERHIIYQCAINKNQIALALKTKELVYLEVIESKEEIFTFEEKRSGNILDYALRYMKFLSNGDTAEYLMLCFENTIEIFSVEDEGISKESFAKLDLLYKPSSLTVHTAGNGDQLISYLTVGFEGGYIQRFIFIHENGELMNSFLLKLEDSKTVTLIKMKIYEEEAIIALTTCCTWISFNCTTQFEFVPLLYEKIDYAVGFSCVSYPMANLIAVLGQRLVFLHVKKSCTLVLENCQQLKLTPRQFTMIEEEEQNLLIISLSDYGKSDHKDGNDSPQYTMDSALGRMYSKDPSPSESCPSEIVKNKPFSRYDCELCIYGTVEKKFFCSFKLPRDHSIVRMCKVEFNSRPDEWYIVAVVKKSSYKHKTVKCKPLPIVESELFFESYLILYSLNEDTYSLKEVCTMKTDYVAEAMCPFAGRVLVGINDTLCLCNFETGLFMETNQKMPCKISDIYAYEDMFVVLCDNRNVIYGYYTETHEEFIVPDLKILCEDQNLHKVTDICFWDQDIMVAADLYGYLNIVLTPAIPDDVTKKDCKLPTRFKKNEEDKLGRDKEPNTEEYRFMPKSYVLTRHYIGETVTCLQLTSFLMESRSLFLYCTLSGTVGVLEPFFDEKPDSIFKPLQFLIKSKCQFHNRDSTDYPSNYVDKEKLNEDQYHVPNQRTSMPLWAALTSEDGNVDSSDTSDEVYTDETSESFSMTGQSSRAKLLTTISSREPPLFVIDGNLCDLFHTLSEEEQQDIADQLDKKPYEISEKLAELKATMHFGVNNDWQKDSQF